MDDKQNRKNRRRKILDTALELAAETGWDNVSFTAVSGRSGLSEDEIYEEFEEKHQILAEYERILNNRVLAGTAGPEGFANPRECLFELLMERFDIMNGDRAALTSVIGSLNAEPKQAVIGAPYLAASMSRILDASGVDTGGFRGAARVAGLTLIYVKVLRDWARDDSPDLSVTMSSLDRALAHAEKAVNSLGL